MMDCTRGKYPELAKLKAEVMEEAERGLGMAMIFTLATLVEQKLGDYVAALKAATKKATAKPVESYNEIRVDPYVCYFSQFHIEIRGYAGDGGALQ